MNENLDLCKILEGCEGVELYSTVYGTVIFQGIVNRQIKLLHHRLNAGDGIVYYELNGHLNSTIADDEVTLFPAKYQRDWSRFVKPIPKDTPFMVCDVPDAGCGWHLYFYANYDEVCEQHRVFLNGEKSKVDYNKPTTKFKYMIPYDKFDPNDIEESLKYNIQK